jgi:hypothetical protein
MGVLYILAAIIELQIMALVGLELYKLHGSVTPHVTKSRKIEDEKSEEERKAAEAEKLWNDAMNSIVGYDLQQARKAVRSDDEEER